MRTSTVARCGWLPLLAFALGAGCTNGVAQLTTPPQPIVGGQIQTGYPSAVYLIGWTGSAYDDLPFCSGVVIAPRLVLTAAHCVQNEPPLRPTFGVGTWDALDASGSARADRAIYGVQEVILHPLYSNQYVYGTDPSRWPSGERFYDIALVYLGVPIDVTPATIANFELDPTSADGWGCQEATAVGYGRTDCAVYESTGPRKSALMCMTDLIEGSMFRMNAKTGSHSYGDSGGPVYAGAAEDQYVFALHRGQGCTGVGDDVTALMPHVMFLNRGLTCVDAADRFACIFPVDGCSADATRYCAGIQATCRRPGGCEVWERSADGDHSLLNRPAPVARAFGQYEVLAASADMLVVREPGWPPSPVYWTYGSPADWQVLPAAPTYAGSPMPAAPLRATCLGPAAEGCQTWRGTSLLLHTQWGDNHARGAQMPMIAFDTRANTACGLLSVPEASNRFAVTMGCDVHYWRVDEVVP